MTQPPDPNPAPYGGPSFGGPGDATQIGPSSFPPPAAPAPTPAAPPQPPFAAPQPPFVPPPQPVPPSQPVQSQPVPPNPAVPSFGPPPAGWSPAPAGAATGPVIAAARPDAARSRSGRAGVLAALLTGLFTAVVANQWVLGALSDIRQAQLRAPIFSLFFAHWSATPISGRGDGFSDVLTHGFWTEANGGVLLQRLQFDDELVHWLFNFVRLGMLVLAVGIAVAVALSRHGGGVLARALSAWGAIAVAAGIVGGLTTAAFSLVTDGRPIPLTAELIAGGAFGAQWALVVGWLIALPAALAARGAR